MGRELKRVPMDFDWPRGEIWKGYLNPHYRQCAACSGRGDTVTDFWRLTEGLAGRPRNGPFGHDCFDRWQAVKKIRRAAKLPADWGICPACNGHGEEPAARRKSARWKRKGPPTGDGYQLWETTSEGSPVSPVFPTLDELCSWCAGSATTFGSSRATAEQWRTMLEAEFVCHEEDMGNGVKAIFI